MTEPSPSFQHAAGAHAPQVVGHTDVLQDSEAAGAVWTLSPEGRDLDANLIHLPAGDAIHEHRGPDRDVLWIIAHGSGTLRTSERHVALNAGDIVWVPAESLRGITAGPSGIGYFTVHRRRENVSLMPRMR